MSLQMNHFIGCASVIEQHAVLLSDKGGMVYAGPLTGITETAFHQATLSLVHPRTLEWIKEQADLAIKTGRYRL